MLCQVGVPVYASAMRSLSHLLVVFISEVKWSFPVVVWLMLVLQGAHVVSTDSVEQRAGVAKQDMNSPR